MQLKKEHKRYIFFNPSTRFFHNNPKIGLSIICCTLACIPFVIYYTFQQINNYNFYKRMGGSSGHFPVREIDTEVVKIYELKNIDEFDNFNKGLINFIKKENVSITEIRGYLKGYDDIYCDFLNDDVIIFTKYLNTNRIMYIINIKNGRAIINVKDIKDENKINFQKLALDNKNITVNIKQYFDNPRQRIEYLTIESNDSN